MVFEVEGWETEGLSFQLLSTGLFETADARTVAVASVIQAATKKTIKNT